jgi:hypothetical protein
VSLPNVQLFIGVLGYRLVDAYLHMRNVKELQDALESKFDTTDVGGELYVTAQLSNYGMVEKCPLVEQAH